jgi:hypothetical protein
MELGETCAAMTPDQDTRAEEIAALIEGYLCLHPHSADGVDGVVWWVPELDLEPRALVLEALERLVERQVAIKKRRDDGTAIYQLNLDRCNGG